MHQLLPSLSRLTIKQRKEKRREMNLIITKSEELDFPNFETWLYTNCKARLAEFNRFGTLLAIGCKYGITLIMDFTSKEIVRIFDYHGNSNLEFNSNIANFVQFSNGDYSQTYDLFEHEQATKKVTKIPSPKSKDRPEVAISCIQWSYDSNYLLVSYQLVNTIILWNVETCEKVHVVPIHDKSFVKAQLYPYNASIAIVSCGDPYIIDMKTQERIKFLTNMKTSGKKHTEEDKMVIGEDLKKSETNSEEWLVLALSRDHLHYFLLVDPRSRLILIKERGKEMEDIEEEKVEVAPDITSLVNEAKFSVVAVLPLVVNGKITSITCDDSQKYVLLNATDRCLRLVKIGYHQKQLSLQKECVDVINRKKWMTTGFFTVGHPEKEQYIVSGVGESGSHDICFISVDKGTIEKRLGPSKEGCVHLCGHYVYHNSIVVVTSNGDLLLWSVRNPKCWAALAPDFTEIEENIEYIEKEEEFDVPNTIYIPPVTDPTEILPVDKKSDYFDVNEDMDAYVHYSTFDIFDHSSSYLPHSNLVVIKPAIKVDFLTMKGRADVKKLKEKMEAKGVFMQKRSDEGAIEIHQSYQYTLLKSVLQDRDQGELYEAASQNL
eukprot:TRINITY_DN2742_c0_g1_i2.p1 TRINITY_DN2742_c0_g1~~TRINITY_DN2742_c0_g1_i2.p1  ORF type:complete len:604 (+),score=55.76 TRINITY_DN2742_c0_g1_i2:1520-3331(+)